MEENKELIITIITIVSGTFSIISSLFNWDFFFESRKAEFFIKIFGRNGSRIFYTLLGFLLFFLAYKINAK